MEKRIYRIYNNQLNPVLWDTNLQLDEKIRQNLLDIANEFYSDTEFTAPITDIRLIGSSVNYNWSKFSDIDVHIVINFNRFDDKKNIRKLADLFKYKWAETHDIQIHGHDVELYIEDSNESPESEAIFSLLKNKWIKTPTKHKISIDKHLILQKYRRIVTQLKSLDPKPTKETIKKLKKLIEKIYDMRKAGLVKHGEFSNENIVFKLLRNTGILDKIRDSKNYIFDTLYSIK